MSNKVTVKKHKKTIPTYIPKPAHELPMFFENKPYQGASGKIYPVPYSDGITDEKKDVDKIFKEIQILEEENIKYLSESMAEVQAELKLSIQTEKIQQAYEFNESQSGSIINLQD